MAQFDQPQHQPPQQMMQQQQQVVIVNQPTAGGAAPVLRDWSTGIFGCFSDIGSCCMGMFFLPYQMCILSSRMGECCCAAHVALPALRTKLRIQNGIQGGVCEDFICAHIFPQLVICQMDRELKNIGR